MSIPASWTTPLQRRYPVQVVCEIIIDPDGENIKLDGFHNLRQALNIPVYSWELDPAYQSEMIFDDMYLDFYDLDEFFHPLTSRDGYKPFKQYTTGLYTTPTATSAILLGHSGVAGFDVFRAGDMVKFVSKSNPTVNDTVKITSVDFYEVVVLGGGNYFLQRIYFEAGSLSGSYVAGDIVTSQPLLGKIAEIRIRLIGQGTSGEYTVFRGIIGDGFEWRSGSALLKLINIYGLFMQNILKIHSTSHTPIQRVNASGKLVASFSWPVKTGTGSQGGQLSYIDSDNAGGYAYDVFGDGSFVFGAHGGNGLHTYSIDGSGNLTHIDSDDQGDSARGVWSDGTFVYLANGTGGLHTYSIDGSGNLTHIDSDDQGDTYTSVWGDGTFIYTTRSGSGLSSYTVDGSGNLTWKNTIDQGYNYNHVWGDGTFIYACAGPNIYSYTIDGSGVLTHKSTYTCSPTLGWINRLWSDGTYLYAVNTKDGIFVLSVSATGTFTLLSRTFISGTYWGIHGGGNLLFVRNLSTGLHSYSLDSNYNLMELDNLSLYSGETVFFDGTFIMGNDASSSIQTFGLDYAYNDMTIYSGANLGQWTFTFSSDRNFTAVGPNTNKAGSTLSDFYDQTGATDSQIKIPSSFWHGTPAAGDIFQFYVSANFSNASVGEIIQELISDYGGLPAAYHNIDTAALSDDSDKITWSFDSSLTVGEAITLMLPHAMGNLYLDECILKFERKEPSA